ncbi:MAG: glutamate synthase (NADPH), homotetrameric [Elusimicrobia bacterium RIFOXYA2_FULL_50_26]|nr:MAG: glutamate synthase (NADPH), homotetrameric [Elusimicrobia bacterium RIFOXYA2_FULL_50_26]
MHMQKRIKINERPASERIKDFKSVVLGYNPEQARQEALRCLQCKNPTCVAGCPVEINIPGFIKALAEDDPAAAIAILKDKNNLPSVCGRVCPQEEQCELKCVLQKKGEPVAIGNLERYAADWEKNKSNPGINVATASNNGIKVAVVGSGPAGLTCAGDLAKKGFAVTVFESLHRAGGVLRYGIPEFRLPAAILDDELRYLESIGVRFVVNALIGRTKTVAELFNEGFRAVFIGTGAGLPAFPGVPGENLNHIYSANEFLVRVNLMRAFEFPRYDTPVYVGKKVAVIGGGNTAMDAARTARRMGAGNVTIIYRRSENEMPARREEIAHAREEGIEFLMLTNPVSFHGDDKGFVQQVECVKMELGAPDASGRRSPAAIAGSNFTLAIDTAIIAIGMSPNPLLISLTPGISTDNRGRLIVDDNLMTTMPGVFAGGDITGGETVIQAMGMGKKAARAIENFLR